MRKHGFRSIFSLLLALMMVCSVLPTAAFAEGNVEPVDQVVEQPTIEEAVETPVEAPKPEEEKTTEAPAEPKTEAVALSMPEEKTLLDSVAMQASVAGETQTAEFQILYLDDDLSTGYRLSDRWKVDYICQYTKNHDATASTGHSIAISKIKAVADQAQIDSGFKIIGWSKYGDAKHNDKINAFPYSIGNESTACTKQETIYIVAQKVTPPKPSDPTESEIKSLLETQVIIHCVNKDAGHKDHGYPLRYELTDVTRVKDGYTCQVWVYAKNGNESYIDEYNVTYPNTNHILDINSDNGIRMFNLKYNDGGDGWYISDREYILPVTFNVKCETVTPPTNVPEAPGDGTIKNLLNGKVFVFCRTAPTHYPMGFEHLLDDSYTLPEGGVVSDGNGGYTYTITVLPDKYVDAYNKSIPKHVLTDTQPATVTLTWNDSTEEWEAPTGEMLVKFYVSCPSMKPTEDEIINDEFHGDVTIRCDNTGAGHNPETYTLTKESIISIADPTYNSKAGMFSCMVTVSSTSYVHQYLDGKHTPDDKTAFVELLWHDGAWHWPSNEDGTASSIIFKVTCETVTPPVDNKPGAPSHDELSKLIGDIIVRCTNTARAHELVLKGYALISDSYTTSGVVGDVENGYTYTVTIKSEKYVNQFDTDSGATHDPKDGTATVTLKYLDADNGWLVTSITPVIFDVACKTETVPPASPTKDYLDNLDETPVDVECVADSATHFLRASYKLSDGNYTIGGVTGNETDGYTCDITIYAEEYVGKYNRLYVGHTLADGETNSKTLTLKYINGEWITDGGYVTFNVKCVVPAKPTENDLAGIKVFVQCTNSGATHGDKRKEYGLIGTDGYYYVGDPTFLESDGKYHCTVNVNGERYVAKYSTDTGVQHSYMSMDTAYKYAYLTATWTDGGYVWSVDKDGSTVTFEARCETVPPAQTFTVTYKDGVAGKAFQDQSYTVPSGSATPAFNGTPYLAGYVFTGWTPAVATTVTANATYIATWKLDTNNNGKPDDEEERYTVTYTDGAGGKAFANQVYTGLLSGTSTPKFNGTPVRAGYYFIGWSPKLSATVTGSVTYTATWTTAYGGLDNVPKTGDNGLTLALSALLLFSFCGAAACVVSTKKRG